MNPDSILESLDPEQRAVALAQDGPVVVLAGAGTGKTRAMTHRIAYGMATGQTAAEELLALTFTAKAAGEMRSRLRGLGAQRVQVRTFHSAALRQLRYFWPRAVGGGEPSLIDHKAGAVAEAARRLGLASDRALVRDLAAEIEWAKVNLLTVDDYLERAGERAEIAGAAPADIARLMGAYEEIKTERGAIDFEDVLLILTGILQDHPDIAAEVRRQYRSFVVDEFQDVSPVQHALLMRWLGKRQSLCVVGDPSQTIYSFAGARADYLLTFRERFPQAEEIRLVRDYRSTPQIVDLANRVLAHGRVEGRLELVSARAGGPQPVFREHSDDQSEADAVAAEIAQRIAAGRSAADFAVLFRTNGQSQNMEEALSAHRVPFVVRGGERFFSRDEVRAAIVTLRAASRTTNPGLPLPRQVEDLLSGHGWSPKAPERGGAQRSRWESMQAIVHLAEQLQAVSELPLPLGALVTELEDRAEHQSAPAIEGVTLASLHAAKGLEWPSVHLIGMSEGLMPIAYAETPEDIAEERRLFYVGITRAETSLQLSWSLARSPGGRAHRKPSRFVSELRVRAEQSRRTGAHPARKKKASARLRFSQCRVCGKPLRSNPSQRLGRCDDCPSPLDPALLESLVAWRTQTAQAMQVPAFMVFTNATLEAIAELLPENREQLGLVPGVGPAKLERHGDAVLAALSAHSAESSGTA